MFNWIGLLLRICYYFGLAIGVGNFEVDWRTGRVFTCPRSTLYAAANNFTTLILVGLRLKEGVKFIIAFGWTNKSYGYVEIIVSILWITAGWIKYVPDYFQKQLTNSKLAVFLSNPGTIIMTRLIYVLYNFSGLAVLLNQWLHQSQLMSLARNAIKLCLVRPQIMRISRWRILFKFINSLLAYIFPYLFGLATIGLKNAKDLSGFLLQIWISAIVSLAISYYFLVMLCVRAHYILFNTELHQVIEESQHLSCNPSRRGAFMTKCCALADQLDDIAKLQSHLQSIVDRLGAVFGIPLLIVYCCYYAGTVGSYYTAYNTFKQNLGMKMRDIIFFFSWSFFFFMDGIQHHFMALHVQDEHQEMIRILDERTVFASGLDVRLEESYESFQLQLIRNPLKMDVLQLYPINRKVTLAMFASILYHSICLVQYDLEN